ncbi:hypothetical protein BAVI_00740 [Neobacillus vireti LMG 21834]|uniref:Uncharacterized protein n=1 Tax=Neobacillus vireti LMG 21834 TaxID=1131730 RepID=A0AB94IV04_9BACI|nr:hypothetical protein BAVI_00740 [Neobacillus vireti LMG 21834]
MSGNVSHSFFLEAISIKIRNKLPEFNEQTHRELLNSAWIPLKEPKTLTSAVVFSIPFMVINVLISVGIIYLFTYLPY